MLMKISDAVEAVEAHGQDAANDKRKRLAIMSCGPVHLSSALGGHTFLMPTSKWQLLKGSTLL